MNPTASTSRSNSTIPFVVGQKEMLIQDQRQSNRIERLKQVRAIEKKLAEERLHAYKSSLASSRSRAQQQTQAQNQSSREVRENTHRNDLLRSLSDVGASHQTAIESSRVAAVHRDCRMFLEAEVEKVTRHRAKLGAWKANEVRDTSRFGIEMRQAKRREAERRKALGWEKENCRDYWKCYLVRDSLDGSDRDENVDGLET